MKILVANLGSTSLKWRLFDFAHTSPLLYGLFTVLMAVALGWASTFFFRART